MKKKINFVVSDGWQALYIDGKLVTQDHTISVSCFAKALGIELTTNEAYGYFDRHDVSHFPQNLEDVEFDY